MWQHDKRGHVLLHAVADCMTYEGRFARGVLAVPPPPPSACTAVVFLSNYRPSLSPFPLILPPRFVLLIGNYLSQIPRAPRTARLTSLLSTVKGRDFTAISPRSVKSEQRATSAAPERGSHVVVLLLFPHRNRSRKGGKWRLSLSRVLRNSASHHGISSLFSSPH